MPDNLPLILGFYGDDFIGSVGALETLTAAGVATALFTKPPAAADLADWCGLQAFGIAGRTRMMTVADVEGTLRLAFEAFRDTGDAVVHYKTNSGFDPPAEEDNIGRIMEVGLDVFGGHVLPLVMTASEGTLRDRFTRQKALTVRPADGTANATERCGRLYEATDGTALSALGHTILSACPRYVIGSGIVETALCAAWTEQGLIRPPTPAAWPTDPGPVIVVCGSRSAVSIEQVRRAIGDGFAEVILSPNALGAGEINNALVNAVVALTHALGAGRSVVLHTHAAHHVAHTVDDDIRVGTTLGHVLRLTLQRRPIKRVMVDGTATCGRVAAAVGVASLTVLSSFMPGTPRCSVRAKTPAIDGLEIVFKAGSAGTPDCFSLYRDGRPKCV